MNNNNNPFEGAIEDLPPEDTGDSGAMPAGRGHKLTLDDFYAVAPDHKCLHRPTRKLWINAAVDARVAWVPRLDALGQPKRHKKTGEVLLDRRASRWRAHAAWME
jgi:hypothetical protein